MMKKKKTIIIFILVAIAILTTTVLCIKPIKSHKYTVEFKDNIYSYLINSEYIDTVSFNGQYALNLSINMNTKFRVMDFEEQEVIIKELFSKMKDTYYSYRNNMYEIDKHIAYEYGNICFFINEKDYYNISFVSDKIHKNGLTITEYTLHDNLREKIIAKLGNLDNTMQSDFIRGYLNSIENVNVLKNILTLENNEDCKKEIIYQYLLQVCNKEDYNATIKSYFSEYMNEYKDFNKLIIDMEKNKPVAIAKPKEKPKIGMTKAEAENSTWGKPQKINKTTTVYGIHEQWVYGNGKYLYFDDGILTSIQE